MLKDKQEQISRLQVLSELVSRATLSGQLGQQYGTNIGTYSRDIYEALGYPLTLSYEDFATRYARQDIARAVIDKPVDGSWQGGCLIQEATDSEQTPLESAWKSLICHPELKVLEKLIKLDKLVGIGSYGVMLFGLNDVAKKEDFVSPASNKAKLMYLRPLGEGSATITEWEKDTSNPRYNMPKYYTVSLTQGDSASIVDFKVHHTRILHVTGDILEGDVIGQSRLEPIYNRLFDLEKLVGGDAEMFWRGARPGYQGKVEDGFTMTQEDEDDLQDQLDEYEHNLRRFLIARGMDIQSLETQVSDPSSHVDVQIQMISAQTGIPKRILTGSERGELASTQDITSWYSLLQARRENYNNSQILRPFIAKCQSFGVLPFAVDESYEIVWQPLFEKTDKEKADVGKTRAEAVNQYVSNPMAEVIIPPKAFYKYFLGLDAAQIEMIETLQDSAMKEDD